MKSRDALLLALWRQGLMEEGSHVLVAVSGGADSMCLLTALHTLAGQKELTLAVAHYHHGLRGEEADRDAAFVEQQSRSLGLPFCLGRGDVAAEAKRRSLGVEETARLLRYQFLEETARQLSAEQGCPWLIATAHNADDNAETILLHLVRGAGLQGLVGIAPKRDNLLRPLLPFTRQEIEAYNERNGVPCLEDSTNADIRYARNYLRHQVMPLLRTLNPNLSQTLGRTASIVERDNEIIERLSVTMDVAMQPAENGIKILVACFDALPDALISRGIQRMYQGVAPDGVLSYEHRAAVIQLARAEHPSGTVDLPDGIRVRREYQWLVMERVQEIPPLQEAALRMPGRIAWGDKTLRVTKCRMRKWRNDGMDLYIKAEPGSLRVRPRRTGDYFRPAGRHGKTIKKWMIDRSIPREQRDRLPVLVDAEDRPVAVPGIGVAEGYTPTQGESCWHIFLN